MASRTFKPVTGTTAESAVLFSGEFTVSASGPVANLTVEKSFGVHAAQWMPDPASNNNYVRVFLDDAFPDLCLVTISQGFKAAGLVQVATTITLTPDAKDPLSVFPEGGRRGYFDVTFNNMLTGVTAPATDLEDSFFTFYGFANNSDAYKGKGEGAYDG